MADYGIKISKPGSNVNTAEKKDLSFTSELSEGKLKLKESGTVTSDTNISHGVSHPPTFELYGLDDTTVKKLSNERCECDSTYVYIDMYIYDKIFYAIYYD